MRGGFLNALLCHHLFNFNTRRWLHKLQCQLRATREVDTKLEATQRGERHTRDDDCERKRIPACTLRNNLELRAEEVVRTPLLEHLRIRATALAMRQEQQEGTGYGDCGEHRERNTNKQCQRKPADRTSTEVVEQEAGYSRTHVRVEDRAKRTSEAGRNGCAKVLTIP